MKLPNFGYFATCASVVLLGVSAIAAPQASGYHLLKRVTFGAAPGADEYFDYVNFDPVMRRAYLSHGTEFIVFDAVKGTTVGTIPGFKRDHGVALVPELNRGFITDGSAAQIIMFDLKTLKVFSQIKGEEDADGIIYDPASKHVFAFNGNSKSATIPLSRKWSKRLRLFWRRRFLSDNHGQVLISCVTGMWNTSTSHSDNAVSQDLASQAI